MAVRVYAPDAAGGESRPLTLSSDESAHLTRVLRLGRGDALQVFDGRGGEWQAVIASASRAGVAVTIGAAVAPAPETRVRYVLAAAVLKGDATDEVVRTATTLGVSAVQPVVTARTEITLAVLARSRRAERWRRVAVAAAKQCGRAVVPVVDAPCAWPGDSDAADGAARLLFVEPGAVRSAVRVGELTAPTGAVLAIGPEGGWTPQEVEAALAAGWRPVTLGGRTLRAGDAPLVALAACQAVWQDA